MTQRVWLGMLDRATELPDETHEGSTAAASADRTAASSRTAESHGVRPLSRDLGRRGGIL